MKKIFFAALLIQLSLIASAKDLIMNTSETTTTFFPEITKAVIEAYENAGHVVTTKELPGERAIALFKSGEIDVDMMRLANFKDIVADAIPIQVVLTTLDMIAIVPIDSPYNSKDDLAGKTMSATRGTKVHDLIASQMGSPKSDQSSFGASAKMVDAGRVDYMPVTRQIAQGFIDSGMKIRVIEEPLLQIPFFTWVTADNADIVDGVAAELQKLKDAGRF